MTSERRGEPSRYQIEISVALEAGSSTHWMYIVRIPGKFPEVPEHASQNWQHLILNVAVVMYGVN